MSTSSSSSSSSSGLGEEIYSGAASFGKFWALLGAIMGTITFIVLTIVGIYILTKKDYRIPINVSIKMINGSASGSCPKSSQDPPSYACTITLNDYVYNGVTYKNVDASYTGNNIYYVGQNITGYINKDAPSNITLNKDPPKWLGWILIAIGVIAVVSGWFWYWATTKWKFLAASQGVGGALDIATGGRL